MGIERERTTMLTDLERFRPIAQSHSDYQDESVTHDGTPWIVFGDEETYYTFFYFDKINENFNNCGSREPTNHQLIDLPKPMRELREIIMGWREETDNAN
jgi:hypothetical protein